MPLVAIPFSGGAFQNVDAAEVLNSDKATVFQNFLLNDAGSNVPRPGLVSFATTSSKVIGSTFFNNKVVSVLEDRSIVAIASDGTVETLTGVKLPGSASPVFAQDGTYLAIAGGQLPVRWSGAGAVEVMPGNPPLCTHIVYLDGYWIANIVGTQEYAIAGPTSVSRETWDPLDFGSAEGLPDQVNAVAINIRELYLLGEQSTEILQNFGDEEQPFQRIFFIDRGTIAPYSVIQANNTIWFLDQSRRFIVMNGRTPEVVSNPYDLIIQRLSVVEDCRAFLIEIENQYLIIWTFPTEKKTFWFSYKNKEWGEFSGWSDGETRAFRGVNHVFAKGWNRHFMGDAKTSSLLQFKVNQFTDVSDEIRKVRRSGPIDHGSSARKRSNFYRIYFKRGTGSLSATNEAKCLMRVRDDENPWTDYQEVSLGRVGDNRIFADVRFRGVYRRRQIEIVHTDPYDFWINKVEEDVELLER